LANFISKFAFQDSPRRVISRIANIIAASVSDSRTFPNAHGSRIAASVADAGVISRINALVPRKLSQTSKACLFASRSAIKQDASVMRGDKANN
jgi:hypothetical protein